MSKRGYIKRDSWGERTRRRQRAAERQAARALRTPSEQLALLAGRRGSSARERARLVSNRSQTPNRTLLERVRADIQALAEADLGVPEPQA